MTEPTLREQAAVLALLKATKGEWYRTAAMIAEAGSALRVLRGDWTGFESLDTKAAKELARSVPKTALGNYAEMIESLAAEGVKTVTVLDRDYPTNLRAIYNLPPFLFIRGALLPDDEKAVAVVGTRQASAEGLRQARELAYGLASRRITILSGLARGIDSAAHEGALDAGGRTVAVMGTGIRKPIYPPENEALADRILRAGGALVSQFWPDAPPRGSNFPMRNVVMSGMAVGTVVVEAGPTSGARMQARLAREHGKRVFLVESLVMQQEWARQLAEHPGVRVVKSAEKIVDLVEQLVRPPAQLSLG
jgi:DNA processing protein